MLKKRLKEAIRALATTAGEIGALSAKKNCDIMHYTQQDHVKLSRAIEKADDLELEIGRTLCGLIILERLKAALWLVSGALVVVCIYITVTGGR